MFGTRQGWSTLVKQQLELVEKKWRLLDSFHLLPMALYFFPFIFQAKTLVLRSKRREMPPENLLPLLLTMDIDRAGACWQGSG